MESDWLGRRVSLRDSGREGTVVRVGRAAPAAPNALLVTIKLNSGWVIASTEAARGSTWDFVAAPGGVSAPAAVSPDVLRA